MKNTIAYQGEPGANSHIACVDNFPDLDPLPCATFEDAFAAVTDGGSELAMIPIAETKTQWAFSDKLKGLTWYPDNAVHWYDLSLAK